MTRRIRILIVKPNSVQQNVRRGEQCVANNVFASSKIGSPPNHDRFIRSYSVHDATCGPNGRLRVVAIWVPPHIYAGTASGACPPVDNPLPPRFLLPLGRPRGRFVLVAGAPSGTVSSAVRLLCSSPPRRRSCRYLSCPLTGVRR